MNQNQAIQKTDRAEREMVFVPFGGADKIRLTVDIVKNLIAVKTRTGQTCSDRDAVKFMALCQAQRLNPFAGDAFLIGYDSQQGPTFSLITAHVAFLKRAETCQDFEGMESGIVLLNEENGETQDREGDFHLPSEKVVGGWARVHRKGRKATYRRIRMERFNKGFAQWKDDPAGMICKCFDDQTEVLTTHGFEKFAVAEGSILQVSETGLEPTEAVPFQKTYSGDMVAYFSDALNFSVTPNHDMATTTGKIEAGAMFKTATLRPKFHIPRKVSGSKPQASVSDSAIILAAAYLCDGSDKPHCSFWISVSRDRKVKRLESLNLHHARHEDTCKDSLSVSASRTITTRKNKSVFGFKFSLIDGLAERGKAPCMDGILNLSQQQARLFVDSLIEFDGHRDKKTGVRRFYASNHKVSAAFELGAVIGGYAVSERKFRNSDIGTKPNAILTISDQDEIPVRKTGLKTYASLELVRNHSGKVWCVTVPSGKIVVRREGFSMLCHNCAESDALRSTFPTLLGGLYSEGETIIDVQSERVASRAVVDSSRLVDVRSVDKAESQEQPQGEQPERQPDQGAAKQQSAGEELGDFCIDNGFSFDHFQKFAMEGNHVPGADSLTSFDEIPEKDARRLLKAKTGLLAGLKKIKEGGAA